MLELELAHRCFCKRAKVAGNRNRKPELLVEEPLEFNYLSVVIGLVLAQVRGEEGYTGAFSGSAEHASV